MADAQLVVEIKTSRRAADAFEANQLSLRPHRSLPRWPYLTPIQFPLDARRTRLRIAEEPKRPQQGSVPPEITTLS